LLDSALHFCNVSKYKNNLKKILKTAENVFNDVSTEISTAPVAILEGYLSAVYALPHTVHTS